GETGSLVPQVSILNDNMAGALAVCGCIMSPGWIWVLAASVELRQRVGRLAATRGALDRSRWQLGPLGQSIFMNCQLARKHRKNLRLCSIVDNLRKGV